MSLFFTEDFICGICPCCIIFHCIIYLKLYSVVDKHLGFLFFSFYFGTNMNIFVHSFSGPKHSFLLCVCVHEYKGILLFQLICFLMRLDMSSILINYSDFIEVL